MDINNVEYLKQIGFSLLYDYKIKRNRENYLVWNQLFSIGEGVRIDLVYEREIWMVASIKVEGENTQKLYQRYLASHNLEDIVNFVLKFPRSTNP
jgi:hypothetical protein